MLIIYFSLGLLVNLVTYIYALIHMDVIKWGKTRSIETDIVSVESLKTEIDINLDETGYVEYARETYV